MELNNSTGLLFPEIRTSDAVISSDGLYRYLLSREWSQNGITVGFICLNPSTADAHVDDQTVRKCVRFAKKWGGKKLLIGNLFAFRSTDPAALKKCQDPIGPDNDHWLDHIASEADILIAAWGNHGILRGRDVIVREKYRGKLNMLRVSKNGHPSHPLYLPESLLPVIFVD